MSDPTAAPEAAAPPTDAAPPAPPEAPERAWEFKAEWDALFQEGAQSPKNREGTLVRATVAALTDTSALLDLGEKPDGELPLAELRAADGALSAKVGDSFEVLIERVESARVVVSKEKADRAKRWDAALAACEKGSVTGTIVARVKGGFAVDIGLRAFLPGSQADARPIHNPDSFIGRSYDFTVIKLDKKRGDVVLSRRSLAEKERGEQREKVQVTLNVGDVVDGRVKNLAPYGAFLDLGGVDGLLSITNISWQRVGAVSDLYRVGDTVKVKVLAINPENGKISLGVKQLQEDPWAHVARDFAVGTKARGAVVSVTDYGAFVELAPGVDGLVHVSEMSWQHLKHPSDAAKVGDVIDVIVLKLDEAGRKIGLGMKQLQQNPWARFLEAHPVGSRVRGTVKNLADFGAFVNVAEGIDGLLHASDISWTVRLRDVGEVLQKGEELEVVVVRADPEKERLSLGLKQKTEDPWPTLPERFPMGRQVSATVKKILSGGFLLALEGDVEGFISKSQFLPSKKDAKRAKAKEGTETAEAPKMPSLGDVLPLQVRECDAEGRRFGLSVRVDLQEEERGDYAAYLAQRGNQDQSAKLGDLSKDKLSF